MSPGPVRLPEPNHPLTAVRRQGIVIDNSGAPGSIQVAIGGDDPTGLGTSCSYLGPYEPQVNDIVYLLQNQADYLVIGAVSQSRDKQSGSFTAVFSTASGVQSTLNFPHTFPAVPNLQWSGQIGGFLDICLNWTGAPSQTSVGYRVFQCRAVNITGTATIYWRGEC